MGSPRQLACRVPMHGPLPAGMRTLVPTKLGAVTRSYESKKSLSTSGNCAQLMICRAAAHLCSVHALSAKLLHGFIDSIASSTLNSWDTLH